MSSPTEIPQKMLSVLAEKLKLHIGEAELQAKLADMQHTFLTSEATVYCEDCGLIFYYGKAGVAVNEKMFVDWKMLSFRHVWDTKHKVKIYLPYMLAQAGVLATKSPAMFAAWNHLKGGLLFDDCNQVEYYRTVEDRRSRLLEINSPKVFRSNDANWDIGSRCVCSVCGKSFTDPKKACLCHADAKPWLPMDEVNTIKVGA